MIKKIKIGFIGGGNMAEALIAALLRKKIYAIKQIGVSEPNKDRIKFLKKKYGIVSFSSNQELAEASSILLLAVKPQHMTEVLEDLQPSLNKNHLLISIAAGLDTSYFFKKISPTTRFIRVMPNACALIGEGAAALYASPSSTAADRQTALKIFQAAGQALFVSDESLLDVVTAVSGSGPAFVYLFAEALIHAAQKRGLSATQARSLVVQTILGSGRMMEKTNEEPQSLIQKVASKGGTTEAGLTILTEGHFKDLIDKTIEKATHRARELRCIS